MRKVLFGVAVTLIFLIGLSVLLYPAVSDYFNSLSQSRVVARYYESTADLNDDEYNAIMESANEYNRSLLSKKNRYKLSDEEYAQYKQELSYKGSDVMGVLEIEVIGVKLPIYHGTSAAALQIGAGHLAGTSLPVGGPSTHAVITGHRGLPSSTLLTHLDKIVIGDTFTITVLNQVLTYQVDQIVVRKPNEVDDLIIEPGKDYCTLGTCTPYGVNSHRLLVRGFRVYPGDEPVVPPETVRVETDAQRLDITRVVAVTTGFALVFLAILMAVKLKRVKLGNK